MMSPLPSVGQTYSIISQEESHRGIIEGAPAQCDTQTVFDFNANAHRNKDDTIRCEHCNWTGHKKNNCYRLIGYPPRHKFHKGKKGGNLNLANKKFTKEGEYTRKPMVNNNFADPGVQSEQHASPITFTPKQYKQILRLLNQDAPIGDHPPPTTNLVGIFANLMNACIQDEWVIDSGANDHMTANLKCLNFVQPYNSCHVSMNLPNGNSTRITHIGTTRIRNKLILHNVLYVPYFTFNLLSISKFTKENHCFIVFYPNFLSISDLWTGIIMGIGKVHQGLYYLVPHTISSSTSTSNFPTSMHSTSCNKKLLVSKAIDINLSHQRPGHVSFSRLGLFYFIINKDTSIQHCAICPLAK
ncbi:hypothetical protein CFOL_v3_26296 [Cephalotus follicularis]|uniref:Retrovirus-related Pol polyprotein from transposon TNT 1-94-like beta-barrel domain-containing protein n=1 Tax=Cephalotus follicularis TaxID=3775 RepID=A0A1Q3CRP1_CEPFO|nr:hypothetical protein CFOL_v3_26296 [Cephalotus follicularis]